MNGRMIGVIGGTGRVGRECLRYLHENTAFGLEDGLWNRRMAVMNV